MLREHTRFPPRFRNPRAHRMLQFLADLAVPGCLFLLMLIAGTEILHDDFLDLPNNSRSIIIGALCPLIVLPPVVLAISALVSPLPVVAAGLLLLSLSPNGGISNSYCYLARCNVLLSAAITAAGTLLCLVTIPIWLRLLTDTPSAAICFRSLPSKKQFSERSRVRQRRQSRIQPLHDILRQALRRRAEM